MKKYKKKVIIVLGKLSVALSILLGVLFGMPSDIYASVYQTGTSDHYSIQVSQLATGREEVVVSWHNLYEGEYYNYVDLVQLRLKGANGTWYQLYLCLHGTDELTVSFTNTDLTNIQVTTVQTWQFNDQNLSQLQTIANRINTIAGNIDDVEYYLTSIISNITYLSTLEDEELQYFRNYLSKIDLHTYNAYLYTTWNFYNTIRWNDTGKYWPDAPRINIYGGTKAYDSRYCIAVHPHSKIIYVVVSERQPLTTWTTSYSSPSYVDNDEVNSYWRYRRISSDFYITAYWYENNSDVAAFYQHQFDTIPTVDYYVYPLYLGPYDECPYLSDLQLKTSSGSVLDQENENLNDTTSDLNTIETQFTTDFDTNINAIDLTSPTIINGTEFLNSANWVRTRFNEITVGNPFGSIIVFSMIIGLALLLIGRVL